MAETNENDAEQTEVRVPTGRLAEVVYDAVRSGDLDRIDLEAILWDADEWVRRSDSPVAARLRRAHVVKIGGPVRQEGADVACPRCDSKRMAPVVGSEHDGKSASICLDCGQARWEPAEGSDRAPDITSPPSTP